VPYYYSEAAAANGKILKRVVKAFDEQDADRQLRKLGLHPMRIESTSAVRKRKHEKTHATRRILRNILFCVASISVVVGVAGYFVLLDFRTEESVIPVGIVLFASDINYGDTPEQRKFAKQVNDLLDNNFPRSFSNVTIRKRSLMLLYENEELERLDSNVEESIVAMVTRGFQRQFDTVRCDVFILRNEKPIAEGHYRDGQVTTSVY